MTLSISYDSEGFPAGAAVANGYARLNTSWDDLLWSAITVGRPDRQYVFAYGAPSAYEALFRLSLMRMTLEQSGPGGRVLRRTKAARTLDPSEKGAVSYFLGLAIAKHFAAQVLKAPWMLHLDVFRPGLDVLLAGRSRPDLIGQNLAGDWIALECKGRVSAPNATAKTKAKEQAERVTSIMGQVPVLNIGAITYFDGDTLRFFWRDPPPNSTVKRPIEVPHRDPSVWRYHYAPTLALIQSKPDEFREMLHREVLMRVDEADVEIGIHPSVLERLVEPGDGDLRNGLRSLKGHNLYRADGIAIVAGDSWKKPFVEAFRINGNR